MIGRLRDLRGRFRHGGAGVRLAERRWRRGRGVRARDCL